ncbi:hypothetical protein [Tropicimonas marinistellae]|uniref:hypothetical protein n=1 Tax=Tropicimonas marinistellae TaxID=1739787 RepID=UPI00083384F3|nr:hypothetical protein [Tropicimonas marinistellae]
MTAPRIRHTAYVIDGAMDILVPRGSSRSLPRTPQLSTDIGIASMDERFTGRETRQHMYHANA